MPMFSATTHISHTDPLKPQKNETKPAEFSSLGMPETAFSDRYRVTSDESAYWFESN